jgi:hypothetical protein
MGGLVFHKGIQYCVAATVEPDVWQWHFQIGEHVRTGKTRTRLGAMAARRVQMKIDAVLRTPGASFASQTAQADLKRSPGEVADGTLKRRRA